MFPPHPECNLTREELEEEEVHYKQVLSTFKSYHEAFNRIITKQKRDFDSLSMEHSQLLLKHYKKINVLLPEAIKMNQIFFNKVIALHEQECSSAFPSLAQDEDKLSSLLRQVVRDWSAEGEEERQACYGPLLQDLCKYFPSMEERRDKHVLVPGAGLARLSYEISQSGFPCQGNEFSLIMLLVSEYFLSNPNLPTNSLQISPFILPFSNHQSINDQFRVISVPDITPQPPPIDFTMIAGDFLNVYAGQKGLWSAIVTSFFLDTAHNILDYIDLIYQLLASGGVWCNSGPLLYHFEDNLNESSIELTMEEIRDALLAKGFRIESEEFIKTFYASNNQSLSSTQYKLWHFVASKV